MTTIGCGLFDDPNYGVFDVSWFDCISLKPNLIQVSDLDLNKSNVISSEQKKSKVHMLKDESIVRMSKEESIIRMSKKESIVKDSE